MIIPGTGAFAFLVLGTLGAFISAVILRRALLAQVTRKGTWNVVIALLTAAQIILLTSLVFSIASTADFPLPV